MEECLIEVNYQFSSYIASRDESDCIQNIQAKIYCIDEENHSSEFVGEIEFKIIHINKVEEYNFDIYTVFDEYEYTFRHAEEFYDFENNQFRDSLLKVFPDLEFASKICIIEKMLIKSQYRGNKLGARVFKDIVFNFDYCELFILQPYPLQFDNSLNNDFKEKYNLNQLGQNEEKAIESLRKYYQSWGLKEIKGVKDLMFYSPFHRNDIFDNREMENI